MSEVKVGDSMNSVESLWRYMSLDKFIDLLDTSELFFSSLSSYSKSDPFEGLLPPVTLEVLGGMFAERFECFKSQVVDMESYVNSLNGQATPKQIQALDDARKLVNTLSDEFNKSYIDVIHSITVNCWHSNSHESEAMWKLYNENDKGIAIKTSPKSLTAAFAKNSDDKAISIGKVKYIDYFDKNLTKDDCKVDGHISPLLKRASYSHEHEVRLFISPKIDAGRVTDAYNPVRVRVDLDLLIEGIYISPYASNLFSSSVKAICKKYGIKSEKIHHSELFTGFESLMNIIKTPN